MQDAVRRTTKSGLLALSLVLPLLADAREQAFRLELEAGPAWQARNDVRIPGDGGTRFSLEDFAGAGPWATGRVVLDWDLGERHGLRFLAAPLGYSETGSFDQPVRFAGEEFAPGAPVDARYRFESWRATYRYRFHAGEAWTAWVGFTANVRDAEIRLRQGETVGRDDDTGFVPLLHLAASYRLGERWSLRGDLDGLAGGPGRLFDLGLKLEYAVDERLHLGLGYRGLEGGVDDDDVYNFAWFNGLTFSAAWRF